MLVLTRTPGTSIVIATSDGLVTVTVLGVRGAQVSIGVDAPKSVRVDREEIAVRRAAEAVE